MDQPQLSCSGWPSGSVSGRRGSHLGTVQKRRLISREDCQLGAHHPGRTLGNVQRRMQILLQGRIGRTYESFFWHATQGDSSPSASVLRFGARLTIAPHDLPRWLDDTNNSEGAKGDAKATVSDGKVKVLLPRRWYVHNACLGNLARHS